MAKQEITYGPERRFIPVCLKFRNGPAHLAFPAGYVESEEPAKMIILDEKRNEVIVYGEDQK